MPPKTRITEDKIISAAIEVARQSGFENINARAVSGQLLQVMIPARFPGAVGTCIHRQSSPFPLTGPR